VLHLKYGSDSFGMIGKLAIVGKRLQCKAEKRTVVVRGIKVRMPFCAGVLVHCILVMGKNVYELFGSCSEEQQARKVTCYNDM
jgi:hypothetical protein